MRRTPSDATMPPDDGPGLLAFDPGRDPAAWRADVAGALRAMLGRTPDPVPLDVRVEWTATRDGYQETRFRFTAEAGQEVPAHLLLPRDTQGPVPVLICLQGHNSGMHISLGQPRSDIDRADIEAGRDYAIQAVRRGWAALVLEQRGFGERVDARPDAFRHGVDRPCHHLTATALLRGRTLLGERVWDVSRAIDALAYFPGLDLLRIGCVGDSTGGTITFFAACTDPRISVAMPVAYVCSFRRSLLEHDHCEDHYLPGFLQSFELGDLAVLIAPRPLVVVAGQEDIAFPIEGTHEAYDRISEIYTWLGSSDRCRLVVGPEGHRFYPDLAWPIFEEVSGWTEKP